MKHNRRAKERGVALVTTMIVVAVLAVVAVAFMQSTSTDRLSSRTAVNYVQARFVAAAGAAAGEWLVADLVRRYPDSATVWQNIGGGAGGAAGTNNEATVLYVRAQSANTTLGARPAQFGGEVSLLARPLVSLQDTTRLFPLSGIATALPAGGADMVNLNATNSSRPRPFVGLRSATNAGAPVTAAQWVYFGANPGPTNANNPAIARYAFWVEDESFKVNVNVATNGPRGADSLGLSPAEVRLDGSWGSSSNAALRSVNAGTVVTARNGLPESNFPTALTAAIPGNVTDEQAADELKFLTTVHSAGLDLSRGGFKRFNLNTVTSDADVRRSLNRVIAAITNSSSVPNFGQRFYRLAADSGGINNNSAVTAAHANIYLQKIAANIRDYVDADDQPTVISNNANFTLQTGRPTNAIYAQGGNTDGPNSVAAIGIENLPRLQEYAIHARLRSMRHDPEDENSFGFVVNTNEGAVNPTSAEYEIWIDHYFEFWNPGNRDITVNDAFLQIDKLPAFTGVDPGDALAQERSITNIPVNATFEAGQVTVLTTAPPLEANSSLLGSRVVYLPVPDADRKFTGKTSAITNASFGGFNRLFRVPMTAGPQTKGAVFLGNANGLLESFVGLPINAQQNVNAIGIDVCVSNAAVQNGLSSLAAGNAFYARGGSLRGNSSNSVAGAPFSTEGDPRALNEQLEFRNFTTAADFDQTRFFVTITNGPSDPNNTLGQPNANFVRATNWVDYSSLSGGVSNAPLVVRNAALQSIGELGHLTDPARVRGVSGALTNIVYSRGGGRTFRIGQSEHPRWYDGIQTNASRTWTSWRLADIFTTTSASNGATSVGPLGNLTNSFGVVRGATNTNGAVITIPGLINPNGALRDGGAAFQAMLHGLTFPSPGINVPPNLAMNPTRVNLVVANFRSHLTNGNGAGLPGGALNPLWERGEISQLSVLNSTDPPLRMGAMFDRGREELVRRSIEMITTRGSIFTVYAIGQTLQGTNVTGTARMRQTFEIEPQFATADAFDDNFNPAQAVRVSRRFAAPTNYTTRVLQTSYD